MIFVICIYNCTVIFQNTYLNKTDIASFASILFCSADEEHSQKSCSQTGITLILLLLFIWGKAASNLLFWYEQVAPGMLIFEE